ncbi:MAG: hypothetical protein H7308_05790 [Chthonomonadaceae bacterium]|nr:hypothetical protein [Chthonomonadaceae bacterium]
MPRANKNRQPTDAMAIKAKPPKVGSPRKDRATLGGLLITPSLAKGIL